MTALRTFVLVTCTVAATWALAGAPAAAAQTPPSNTDAPDSRPDKVSFRIAAQPIDGALKEFASQANLQLVYETAEVSPNIRSSHVAGAFTPEGALSRLLAHTNLAYKFINSRTVSIRSAEMTAPTAARAVGEHLSGETTSLSQNSQSAETHNTSPYPTAAEDVQSNLRLAALEEVIVTAQKRAERLIDVPISIVAMSADELEKRNVTSIDDLASAVPGLAIANGDGGLYRRIMVRGISNVSGNSSLIGLYLDEADITPNRSFIQPDLRTYDLERIEVLRGPQGTLYGNGSMGGTIRFITKNPSLDRFAMNADIAALFTDGGAPSQRIESMINVPLVDEMLALRVVGTFDHAGGWIDQPVADRKNINDQNVVDVRSKLLWKPNSQFSANAMAVIHRNDAGINIGEDANGNYTQNFNLTTTPHQNDDYSLYNLVLNYDVTGVRILNTTSYEEQDKKILDLGYLFPVAAAPAPPFQIYEPLTLIHSKYLTDEFRLNSTDTGPWQWTVGGVYRHVTLLDDIPAFYFAAPIAPGAALPTPFPSKFTERSNSWATFGDASYKLFDRITLGVGLRYFHDDQKYNNGVVQTGSFHSLDPRFYAEYKLADQVNIYASAAKGFRSGGFNQLNQPTFGPEKVWTYELGTKTSFADGHFNFDVDIFHSDYTGYQTFGLLRPPALPIAITSNAGDAKIDGVEWASNWRLSNQWTFSFNGDYLHTRFSKIDVNFSAYDVGDPLDVIPKYGITLSAQRDFNWNGKPGFVRLDYNEQGPETYRNRGLGSFYFDKSAVIDILNFESELLWNDSLSLGLFAQNLLNDRGETDPFSIEGSATRSRPRTVGIRFRFRT